ncbi:AAA family ATPase [Streptomyces olivaceus]|uniref:DnaB-like helicase N-terminal domain-containing protein n=1 Tax=Streptomyces olivaceus TaxID=47716 RepID=UPI001CC98C44|nr:DnaB-like helicase N-terminal domain-containing protein [Streptomyces olivaceus]MBZ6086588.1 AAA family ATPase [Streptomyces olivaceus]
MTTQDEAPDWSVRDQQRLELEKAVVGTVLLSPHQYAGVAEVIHPNMLRHAETRIIWDLLARRIPAGEPTDFLALQLALSEQDLKRVGGPAAFSLLANHSVGSALWHADRLREHVVRDTLTGTLRGTITRIQQDDDFEAALEDLTTTLTDITVTSTESGTSDWSEVDLNPVLDGTHKPAQPIVGARNDGVGLFYPGRVNGIQGESEAGKSWVALICCLVEINRGHHVFYLDFEDSEEGIVSRLMLLGADPDDVRTFFHYIRPATAPTTSTIKTLGRRISSLEATLAVLDGVTEAMTMMGLELKENSDIAKFGRMLLRPLATTGAAVVALDHVVKSTESRGRYSLGGVHKLNAVDGVQYMLEAVRPFGVNAEGRSRLRIAKDRPAQVRRHALPGGKNPMHWFADLVIVWRSDDFSEALLYPPIQHTDDPAERTAEEEKRVKAEAEIADRKKAVLRVLAEAAEPLSKNVIEDLVPGNRSTTRRALTLLVHDGQVVITHGARNAVLHSLPKKGGGEA